MAFSISTDIQINAPVQTIWKILMDFDAYPEWNPFVRSIQGKAEPGQPLAITLQPPGGSAMKMKPNVLEATENSTFRWLGHLGFKGIFDGEHIFQLRENSDGSTTLIQSENFSGILVPVFKKMLLGKHWMVFGL